MTQATILGDRGVVSVTGADAGKLLGGLITNEMSQLDAAPALYAGLLAPQGKMLFDFFVMKTADGFLLETLKARAGELVKRLTMYKLRAAAEIRDVSDAYRVGAVWDGLAAPDDAAGGDVLMFADPRLAALGQRALVPSAMSGTAFAQSIGASAATEDAYHAHRIGLGVPEGGRDFVFGDTFPHEALLDQLHGVSFTKGCFVGQEVVSRMQHRATVRKRIVMVRADADLPNESLPVLAGQADIGRLGSVAGACGLALARIDRVAEAQRDDTPVTIGGVPVRVEAPGFASFRIEVAA